MRDLDDPDNPYRDSYEPWDYWALANPGWPSLEERRACVARQQAEGMVWESWYVNDEGFVLPYLCSLELLLEADRGRPAGDSEDECHLSFSVWGRMEPELEAAHEAACDQIWARFLPPIPAWLAASPPKQAMLLPDGCVATKGALGSYDGSGTIILLTESSWEETPEPWHLYSQTGELLRQTEEGGWCEDLFDGEYRAADPLHSLFYSGWYELAFARADARGWIGAFPERDYLLFYDRERTQIVAIYDYDGTCLPPDYDIFARDGNQFSTLSGDFLVRIYAVQQASQN